MGQGGEACKMSPWEEAVGPPAEAGGGGVRLLGVFIAQVHHS